MDQKRVHVGSVKQLVIVYIKIVLGMERGKLEVRSEVIRVQVRDAVRVWGVSVTHNNFATLPYNTSSLAACALSGTCLWPNLSQDEMVYIFYWFLKMFSGYE